VQAESVIAPLEKFAAAEAASSATKNPAFAVQPVNPLEIQNWDALVVNCPVFSFFHSAPWAKTLTETYGFLPNYFVARRGTEIESLLPMMEVSSWLTGRRGVALPFTDSCEPVCTDKNSFQEVFSSAIGFGKSRGWKYLECRGGGKFFDGVPPSVSFFGHCLDLNFSEEKVLGRLENSVRRAIRKAEKEGVTAEISQSLDALKVFYFLQCKTRKKHGLPPQPFSFFLNIHKYILSQNLGMVVLAKYGKTPIAGSVYFHLAGRAIYKYGASDERFQQLRGSNLTMWEAIKWYVCHGVHELHLGKTSFANDGLRRFKLGWGADEEQINYFKYDLRMGKFITERDEAFGWYNRIFRVMPIRVLRLVGELLYRHSA